MDTLNELNQARDPWYRKKRNWVIAVVLVVVSVGVSSLDSAVPVVKQDSVFMDNVRQGNLDIEVVGTGLLVPEEIHIISANMAARVEKVEFLAGAEVNEDTTIIRLSNPEILKALDEAQLRLDLEVARYNALIEQQQNDLMDQKASVNASKVDYQIIMSRMKSEEVLFKKSIVSELDFLRTQLESKQLAERVDIEEQRLKRLEPLHNAQRIAAEAQLALVRRDLSLKKELYDSLSVKAGTTGILQTMNVERGQSVSLGQVLAEVADQNSLKGEIKIIESQAKYLQAGQQIKLQAGKTEINGKVSRIDPSVTNGTVTLDVALESPLPKEIRPNLRITGTVNIDSLSNVLYVSKPVQSPTNGTLELYVVNDDSVASMASVRFGRESSDEIEIISGLSAGDRVVLSDMSYLKGAKSFEIR